MERIIALHTLPTENGGEHMSAGTFEGVSKNGQFEEALAIAIAAAMKGLKTDIVRWTLQEMSGEVGGSALAHNLKVTIDARLTSGS